MILQGGRKWDGLAVNGDTEHPDTQVPTDKLVTRNYTNAGYRIEPPFFFLATFKPRLARGRAIFSHQGRGDRDAVVAMGGAQTQRTPGSKSEDVSSTHPEQLVPSKKLKLQMYRQPGTGREEITNDNA